MKRNALGRGLNALIPESLQDSAAGVISVDVSLISPNPYQPRVKINEGALTELTASIREHGVVQPILVTRAGHGYQLVAGERRWRAAQLAGLKVIPAIVRDFTESQRLEIALIENLQREDLNPIDEALAYQKLIDLFGCSQEEVAKRVGKERPSVANTLRLLRLPETIRNLLSERRLSVGHAKALMSLGSESLQVKAAEQILHQNLSVRQSEELVRRLSERASSTTTVPTLPESEDPNTLAAEDRLRRHLGTKIKIKRLGSGGRIEIEFYSEEELQRIFSLIVP